MSSAVLNTTATISNTTEHPSDLYIPCNRDEDCWEYDVGLTCWTRDYGGSANYLAQFNVTKSPDDIGVCACKLLFAITHDGEDECAFENGGDWRAACVRSARGCGDRAPNQSVFAVLNCLSLCFSLFVVFRGTKLVLTKIKKRSKGLKLDAALVSLYFGIASAALQALWPVGNLYMVLSGDIRTGSVIVYMISLPFGCSAFFVSSLTISLSWIRITKRASTKNQKKIQNLVAGVSAFVTVLLLLVFTVLQNKPVGGIITVLVAVIIGANFFYGGMRLSKTLQDANSKLKKSTSKSSDTKGKPRRSSAELILWTVRRLACCYASYCVFAMTYSSLSLRGRYSIAVATVSGVIVVCMNCSAVFGILFIVMYLEAGKRGKSSKVGTSSVSSESSSGSGGSGGSSGA